MHMRGHTRGYPQAPRLPGDSTQGALRLLLQFGLPPPAWGWKDVPDRSLSDQKEPGEEANSADDPEAEM